MQNNGTMWNDVKGQDIQAHGGCILFYEDRYYWYGEHKGQSNHPTAWRVDIIGIACYSSQDLVNWKYEGLVLPAEEGISSLMHPSRVAERPKVLYNARTKEFVMWLHLDDATYSFARAGVAVSDSPTGPFRIVGAHRPNGKLSRDMTCYVDEDGTAYLIQASGDKNETLVVHELDASYQSFTGKYKEIMIDQMREAPCICRKDGTYYMVTSGCTGWRCNSALLSVSDNMMGPWKLTENPCEGPKYRTTFDGQCSFIFEANGKFYIMIDHWVPHNLQKSGYSILPIHMDNKSMTVVWQEQWMGI